MAPSPPRPARGAPTAGLLFGYQWYVDGVLVDGATTTTYAPVEADYDKTVTVVVSATSARLPAGLPVLGGDIGRVALPAHQHRGAHPDRHPAGRRHPDGGQPARGTPRRITYDYEWMVGGVPAGDRASATYSPTADDVGKASSCG